MDDLGANKWLLDHYGTTIDGLPLFRVIWSTGVTEKRKGTFMDFLDDIFIREVTEVREVLKYPFAQDRWILERITVTPEEIYDIEIFTKFTYEAIYIFENNQTKEYLPMDLNMLQVAMYLYLTTSIQTVPDKLKNITAMLAERERMKKAEVRALIGDALRSPYFFVRE